MAITAEELAAELRAAEAAHGEYERQLGHADPDWPAWYAQFIVARWREEPGGGTHELLLDDDEHELLQAAVHAYLDDFGHEEADVLRRVKDLHAKVQQA
jgi:hypothetical protein